jgi:hypothetical protein
MKLARHWSKQSAFATYEGARIEVACWRGSSASAEDAARLAREAAQRLAQWVETEGTFGPGHGYGYSDRPLKEEILQEVADASGDLAAAITRNAMGARVLNAARAMFVDVDFAPLGLWERLMALLGRGPATPEEKALARIATWLAARPAWGFRVYRTPNGLRLLATHAPQEPAAAETRRVLAELDCDPLFITLCRVQESFRARLDPKPFRVGLKTMPPAFPRETSEQKIALEAWLREYGRRCEGHAACAFRVHLGNPAVHRELAPIVKLHDEASGALRSGARLA